MRFRCVCTAWRSLIADPYFPKKQSKYSDLRLLISLKPPRTMSLADLKCLTDAELAEQFRGDLVPTREHDFPGSLDFVSGNDIVNLGCCNGLICIQWSPGEYVLWNPCTGEYNNVLPKPSVLCYPKYYGFGHDEINDDYKVVLGSRYEIDWSTGLVESIILVFSLKKGTWKTYPGPKDAHIRGQGGFVNGMLHWLCFDERSEIWPFSLAEEKFQEAMPIPWSGITDLLISGNRLCVYSELMAVKIMMMKQYGVKESWTEMLYLKFFTHEFRINHGIYFVQPLWLLENGNVLAYAYQTGGYLSLYKPKHKAFRNVIKLDESCMFESVIYREFCFTNYWQS